MNKSLEYIYKQQKEFFTYSQISALLGWDQMTYMPPSGIEERSEQSALISKILHKKITSEKLWNNLNRLLNDKNFEDFSEKDKSVIKRLEKDVIKSRKIPNEYVHRFSKVTSIAYNVWQEARSKNKFSIFMPHLEKIIEMKKEYCNFINLPGSDYNSILDDYEEGMTVDVLKKQFGFLKNNLIDLLNNILSSDRYCVKFNFDNNFSKLKQKELCKYVLNRMNLLSENSRMDISTHPFTTSLGYNDVRITTNFERIDPLFSFFSTIHEGGHALYELSMPKGEFKNTVISGSPSLGLHESQSRFWENMIGRNKHFWNYFYPIFIRYFKKNFSNIDFKSWYEYVNQIKPSLIRVEADELTYCLHIILRFEIEMDAICDKIKVSEIPEIWNEKMQNMLGVCPNNDREGVLQDMHWSVGSFGYFPTYAIGTIYSAQLFKQLTEDIPSILMEIEKGDFQNILSWLNSNIYRYGSLFNADEIIKKTCGEGLNSQVFINYLSNKYKEIYNF